jgi:hypothetical protein
VRSFVDLVSVVQVLVLVTEHGRFGEDHRLVQKGPQDRRQPSLGCCSEGGLCPPCLHMVPGRIRAVLPWSVLPVVAQAVSCTPWEFAGVTWVPACFNPC